MLRAVDRRLLVGEQLGNVFGGRHVEAPGAILPDWQPGGIFVSLSAHASANTKGAYTELVSAAGNTYDKYGIGLQILQDPAQFTRDCLFDIAIGEAGVEVVVLSNILYSMPTHAGGLCGAFPLFIPRGVRIAVCFQSSTGSSTNKVVPTWFSRNAWVRKLTYCDTYGADTSDSGGLSVDPGAAADTQGAWTLLSASTSRRIRMVCFTVGAQLNSARSTGYHFPRLGVGAGGAEVEKLFFVFESAAFFDGVQPYFFGPFPIDIPAGSRLTLAGQSNITDATDRLIDYVMYGFG
jgi:hypothetical protein